MKRRYFLVITMLIIPVLLAIGCGGEELTAQDGDLVAVHYTGTLSDGTQFDSSYDRGEPLEFTAGAGGMITGFDNAVKGMKVGDKKTVTLPPEEAYGEWDESKVITFDRSEFEEPLAYSVRDQLPLQTSSGAVVTFPIVEITDDYVAVDTNHQLAGKTLTFEIEMVKIERPG